jgi:uncharacterized protein (DUF934 family)
MPLIKHGRLSDDPWVSVGVDEPLPQGAPVIVPLARWQTERDVLLSRGTPLGVLLKSNEQAKDIAADLPHLALVALEFPTFRDGRAYSTARLLRERYHFAGELRAVGDVLRDQYLFMQRCGIDALEVSDQAALAAWSEAIREFSVFYQPAADDRLSAPLARRLRRAAE